MMLELPDLRSFADASERLHTLVNQASADLDVVLGAGPVPAWRRHFAAVCERAEREATLAVSDPARLGADSILLRLRDPEYLRAICDHPVPVPRSWLMMVPVLIAWAFLGAAEFWYQRRQRDDPASVVDGFFAAWTGAPVAFSPVAMAVCVILAVLVIIGQYIRHARALTTADRVAEITHHLAVDLGDCVQAVLDRLPIAGPEDATRHAARDLGAAAARFTAAAATIDASMQGLRHLSDVVDRLAQLGPTLGPQLEDLRSATGELNEAVADIGAEGRALKSAVDTTFTAARNASKAERAAEHAATTTTAAAQRIIAAEQVVTTQVSTLEQVNEPFVEAMLSASEMAVALRAAVADLATVAATLDSAVERANWITMIADGMRDGRDPRERPPEMA